MHDPFDGMSKLDNQCPLTCPDDEEVRSRPIQTRDVGSTGPQEKSLHFWNVKDLVLGCFPE